MYNLFNLNNDVNQLSGVKIRTIFSSYSMFKNANGFPDGKSHCDNCTTEICRNSCQYSVPYEKAFKLCSEGYDSGDINQNNFKNGTYTRVHRDIGIINAMRKWLGLESVNKDNLCNEEKEIIDNFNSVPTTLPITTTVSTSPQEYIITTLPKITIISTLPKIVDSTIYEKNKITITPETSLKSTTTLHIPNSIITSFPEFSQNLSRPNIIIPVVIDSTQDINITNDKMIIIDNNITNYIETDNLNMTNKTNEKDIFNEESCIKYTFNEIKSAKTKLKFYKFKVMKCFDLVFSFDTFKNNTTSQLLLVYSLLYLVFLIIYLIQGIDPLILYRILNIMVKYENKNKNHVCHHPRKENHPIKKEIPHICHHNKDKTKPKKNIGLNDEKNIQHICHHKRRKLEKNNEIKIMSSKNLKNIILNTQNIPKESYLNTPIFSENNEYDKSNKFIRYQKKMKNPPKKKKKYNDNNDKTQGISNESLIKSKNDNLLIYKTINSSKKDTYDKKENIEIKNIKGSKIIKKYLKRNRKLTDCELHVLDFLGMKKYDKRTFCEIYFGIIKREQIILFIFFSCNDYNLLNAKLARFIFIFYTSMLMNVLFFSEKTLTIIYMDNYRYDISLQIGQIFLSSLITIIIEIFVCFLTLTDRHVYKIRNLIYNKDIYANGDKIYEIYKSIKRKLIIYFIFSFLLIIFYWYYISAFTSVYVECQITLIINHLISKIIVMIYPLFFYLLISLLRKISLNSENKNRGKCLHNISKIIPFF